MSAQFEVDLNRSNIFVNSCCGYKADVRSLQNDIVNLIFNVFHERNAVDYVRQVQLVDLTLHEHLVDRIDLSYEVGFLLLGFVFPLDYFQDFCFRGRDFG